MTAQLALSNAWLSSGNLINARSSADHFLGTALSTPDPYFRALAWDLKARLAMAAGDDKGAREHIDQALSILENFVVPMAAWQVNATAREWNLRIKNGRAAEMHRADAAGYIIGVANSFMPDEPLRASFLAAAPIQGIVGQHPDKRRGCTSATS